MERELLVSVPSGPVELEGNLELVDNPRGFVLFAHGSGSSWNSPRNCYVAQQLQDAGFATLLLDLLTAAEGAADECTAHFRFDIELLAERLLGATDWLHSQPLTRELRVGYFGASTGAAAALVAASRRPQVVGAVVSRGGRPDLAGSALANVRAATLLIVGGADLPVIPLNHSALDELIIADEKRLVIVPSATHLFEEPGTLDEVGRFAADWFAHHLNQVAAVFD